MISSVSKSFLVPLTAVMVLILPLQAQAVDITLDSITGTWIETTGDAGVSGIGTNEIRWGIPAGTDQSGYRFDPAPTIFPVSIDVPFILGTFTHFNEPIFGSSIDSAKLLTSVDLTVGGSPITGLNFTFNFLHDETPNVSPCGAGSVSVCDDIVQFLNNDIDDILTESFNIDGIEYTLKLTGFKQGGQLVDEFLTQENQTNMAQLEAVLVEVPEPSTYLMLATALLGVILIKMRKKAAVKR